MNGLRYMLDTNVLIELIRKNPIVVENLRQQGLRRCCISVISVHELYYGAYNAPEKYREQELIRVEKIVHHFPIVPLPDDGHYVGKMKAPLTKSGVIIDDFDMLIAASAIRNELVVVTDNTKHFARVGELQIENWTASRTKNFK